MLKIKSKIIALSILVVSFLSTNVQGMSYVRSFYNFLTGANSNTERFEKARTALKDYREALKKFDPEKTEAALENIKRARKSFSCWDRWFGSNITIADELTLSELNNDSALLSKYYSIRNEHGKDDLSGKVNPNDRTDEQIPNIIKRSLGYGRYVDAREVISDLLNAARANDAAGLNAAIQRARQVRKQFSFAESWLEITAPALRIGEHFDRQLLFNNVGLTEEIYQRISGGQDLKKCEETINSAQQEFDIKGQAIKESNSEYNFDIRRPAFLQALYTVKTSLNSKKILEVALKKDDSEAVQIILKNNPHLKKIILNK